MNLINHPLEVAIPQIEFGLVLPLVPKNPDQRSRFVSDLGLALTRIAGHFDSARMIDHLSNNTDGDDMESFTTLAYLAGLHPQLKFGHMVLCQSFRNPALVAKMGATLQFLSGGRYLLGLGTGWDAAEYRAYGYDFPPARVRVEQLEEAIQIIQALWSEPQATFIGQYYRVNAAVCEPKPNPLPPLMLGAFKPKMLRLTAKYADEWNVSSTGIGKYRRLAADFERACAEVGRDPATVRRSWGGGCICRLTQAEAVRLAGERYGKDPEADFDFFGTPGQLIEQMLPFIDLGVSSFLVDCGGFPDLTTLELIIQEVIPALKHG